MVGMMNDKTLKKCPKCAEEVRAEAQICRFCHYEFPQPIVHPESQTTYKEPISWEMKIRKKKKNFEVRDGELFSRVRSDQMKRKPPRNFTPIQVILGVLGFFALVIIVLAAFIGHLPGSEKSKVERETIRRDLMEWCQSLNDTHLGGAAHDLKTGYLLAVLEESGAKWELDKYSLESFPKTVTLIGRVDPGIWKRFYYKDKRMLLVDLEWSLQEKTRQMDVKDEELGSLPFRIEIRDVYTDKVIAERVPALLSDRFKFYE